MTKRKSLSHSDQRIWDHVRASIKPIEGRLAPSTDELDAWLEENTETKGGAHYYDPPKPDNAPLKKIEPVFGAVGMMRSKRRALTRGQLEPTARIDLHGDRLEVARDRFERFVKTSAQDRHKLVLVVTGKGGQVRQSDFGVQVSGVIKRAFPEWVSASEMSKLIAHYCPSHKKHGGDGAFYIFIRSKARR